MTEPSFSVIAGLETDDSDEEDLIIASAPKRRPEITPAKVC